MARLENCVATLIEVFNEYADSDGYICRDDFKDMLEREISNSEVKAEISEETLDRILDEMDRDKDGYFSIREFCSCVAHVTKYLYHVDKVL